MENFKKNEDENENEQVLDNICVDFCEMIEQTISDIDKFRLDFSVFEKPTKTTNFLNAYEEKTDFGTILTSNILIEGNLVAEGNLTIYCQIDGNVVTKDKLYLRYIFSGAAFASEIETNGATVDGNLVSEGKIIIDDTSIVGGSGFAKELLCNGNLTGNYEISGHAHFLSGCVFTGEVRCKTIKIEKGAEMKGKIVLNYTGNEGI